MHLRWNKDLFYAFTTDYQQSINPNSWLFTTLKTYKKHKNFQKIKLIIVFILEKIAFVSHRLYHRFSIFFWKSK